MSENEINTNEGTSARTRPLGFEEIMQRRKNKLLEPSRRESSPKESSIRDDSPKESSRMGDSPKEPSRWGDSLKESSQMDDSPKEPCKLDDSPKEPSKMDETKKEGFRLASMVVSVSLEREKEEELDEKVKERERERERERKRSEDLERKRKKENIKEEPISKKRDLRNKIDSGNKSRERDRSRERNRSRERDRSRERNRSGERERDRSKRKRSSSREKLERERGRRSRERLGGYSPRKRKSRERRSDKEERERKPEKKDVKSERSPERKSDKRKDQSAKSPERKSEKRMDKSVKSPVRKSDKRNDKSAKSPERKSDKRKDKSEKSEKRKDQSEKSPERKKPVERKSDKWDQLPPAGASGLVSLDSIINSLNNVIQKPVPVEPVQLTQATRPQRRLYIENISESVSEKMLVDGLNRFFNGSDPCLTCTINKEKKQGLVEFLTPEDATKALLFDGKILLGSVLKIRRPKDYVETPNIVEDKQPVEEEKVISNVVKDSPDKIFVAGISKSLSSEMLMEIVSVFGPLSAYNFTYSEELGAPCAFLEYVDHSVTLKACAGLNGMKLGGCVLTVVRALPNQPCEKEDSEKLPFNGVPAHAKSLLVGPTEVLQLTNLFNKDEFLNLPKTELDEILEDIRLECKRFGTVRSVKVVPYIQKEQNSGTDEIITKAPEKEENTDSVQEIEKSWINDIPTKEELVRSNELITGEDGFEEGSVLVEFVRKEATQIAAHVLCGRLYGERVVSTRYVPLELYLQKFPK